MRRLTLATAIMALLVADPARAFDAADIKGLLLGMQEPEVIAQLEHEGYTASHTPDGVEVNTIDGRVRIALSAGRGVTEISYVFRSRGPGEPAKIREAILDRFGAPDQIKPPTWCQAVGKDGVCPPNQASLTFLPESLTLLLRVANRVTGSPERNK